MIKLFISCKKTICANELDSFLSVSPPLTLSGRPTICWSDWKKKHIHTIELSISRLKRDTIPIDKRESEFPVSQQKGVRCSNWNVVCDYVFFSRRLQQIRWRITNVGLEKKFLSTHCSFVRWFVAFSWFFLQAPPFPAVVADPVNHVAPSSTMHSICTMTAVEAPQCGMVLHCICKLFFDYHCYRHLSLKPLSMMILLRVLFALWRNNNAIVMRFCRQWLQNYRYPTVTLPEWKATNETFRSERVYFKFAK